MRNLLKVRLFQAQIHSCFSRVLLFQRITLTTGRGSGGFFDFVGIVPHVMGTSSVNYISIVFIPIAGMAFDVCWKVFSNMFYPTQTQIHVELESKEISEKKCARRSKRKSDQSNDNDTWRS